MFLHCHLVLEPTYYAHSNCEKDYLREMRPKLDSGLNCTTLRSNLTKFAHPRMIVFKRSTLSFLIWSQEKSLIISKPSRRWFHHVDVYRLAQRLVFIGGIEAVQPLVRPHRSDRPTTKTRRGAHGVSRTNIDREGGSSCIGCVDIR
jgi:hypothetical protein